MLKICLVFANLSLSMLINVMLIKKHVPDFESPAPIPNALTIILQWVPEIGRSMGVITEVQHPFQIS